MKTLFKIVLVAAISLLFMHCKPEPIEPEPIEPEPIEAIHYVDYNPDICFDFDDTAVLKNTYIDLFEDNKNDIYVEQYTEYSPMMTCLHDSISIYCGQRWSSKLEPILENVGIGNHINDLNWKQKIGGNISLIPSYTDVFIALKFLKKDGVHYGWMRVREENRERKWFIKDYAIHNTAEASILTGQKEEE